jgi:Spy/CpxP family protein refolding chaperone
MMKSNKFIIIVLTALVALILGGCYRTPEQRAEHMVKYLAAELKLDDSQKAQFEKIKDEFLTMRPGMTKMREETVREANDLMRGAEIDKTRLNALVDKNQSQVNDIMRFVVAKFTEIHDMLTPEQREKLVVMIETHMTDKRPAGTQQEKAHSDY